MSITFKMVTKMCINAQDTQTSQSKPLVRGVPRESRNESECLSVVPFNTWEVSAPCSDANARYENWEKIKQASQPVSDQDKGSNRSKGCQGGQDQGLELSTKTVSFLILFRIRFWLNRMISVHYVVRFRIWAQEPKLCIETRLMALSPLSTFFWSILKIGQKMSFRIFVGRFLGDFWMISGWFSEYVWINFGWFWNYLAIKNNLKTINCYLYT